MLDEEKKTEEADDLRGQIEAAVKGVDETVDSEPEPTTEELEVAETETPATPETQAIEEPPKNIPSSVRKHWASLDPEVRKEIATREANIHRMFTAEDGELAVGRKMKEVIAPYLPMIRAEGGTAEGAVKDLLNTAYILRAGNPEQKAAIIRQVAKQYGVDLGSAVQQTQPDNDIMAIKRQLEEMKKVANPDAIYGHLQERMEYDKIQQDISAFAADPAHPHFSTVKTLMGAIMANGGAETMQEAYDMACRAHPQTRSVLDAEVAAKAAQEAEEKRKAALEAKRKASVSVTGSSGSQNSTGQSHNNDDDLRGAIRKAMLGEKI